jgi:sugar porter (SP) family MFS transporter
MQDTPRYLFNLRGPALRSAQTWAAILPAYILFGWNNAVAGPLLDLESWTQTFPDIDTVNTTGGIKEHNAKVQGTVVAIYTLGAFFGACSCIYFGDKLGRIRTIRLGAAVDILGTVLQASSFSLPQLVVGRFITGLGFGALSATAPNWQSECSQSNHRGAAVVLESLFISAGLALSAWFNLGMSFTEGSISWRLPLAMSALWASIVLVVVGMLPESPRWLLLKGRTAEAKEVLAALEGRDPDDTLVLEGVAEIAKSIELTGQGRFIDVFKNGELRLFNRACLACAGQMFQQLTGINAIAFYQTTIFKQYLGLPGTTARILTASLFTFQTLCSPVGVLTVDRFGRRKLMLISAFGMGTCMAIVAGTASQAPNVACVSAASAFLFLFSLFFPVGFLGLTFLYASEISPLMVRVPITAMSTGSAWIFK